MFSLVGCGEKNGNYVQDSFSESIHYYSTLGEAIVSAEFQVYLPDQAIYDISFTLMLYCGDELVDQKTFTETRKSDGKQTVKMFEYWTAYELGYNLSQYSFEMRLSNLTAIPKSSSSHYSSLAIGFGVTGGLLLLSLIVLFICMKNKGDKAQAE